MWALWTLIEARLSRSSGSNAARKNESGLICPARMAWRKPDSRMRSRNCAIEEIGMRADQSAMASVEDGVVPLIPSAPRRFTPTARAPWRTSRGSAPAPARTSRSSGTAYAADGAGGGVGMAERIAERPCGDKPPGRWTRFRRNFADAPLARVAGMVYTGSLFRHDVCMADPGEKR